MRPRIPRSGLIGNEEKCVESLFRFLGGNGSRYPLRPYLSYIEERKYYTRMTIQELGLSRNLRVVEEAWVEALTKKSIEEFLKKHSEDIVVYDPTLPGPLRGQPALRELVEGLYRMFPDYQVKKVRSFGQDEWVCLEAEETGTMKGSLHGPGGRTIPPTNRSFKIQSTFVCKVLGGKISEIRVYFDVMGLMAQLGLGPS